MTHSFPTRRSSDHLELAAVDRDDRMREDLDLPAQRNELAACRTRTIVLPVRRTCLAGIHKAMAIKSFPNKCRHRAQRNSPGHGQSDTTTASVGRGESFTQSQNGRAHV